MSAPRHHFPDDVLRTTAIGTAPEATRLAVACHLAFCAECQAATAEHEAILRGLARRFAADDGRGTEAEHRSDAGPSAAPEPRSSASAEGRGRLLAELAPQPPRAAPPPPSPLPADLPALPEVLTAQLGGLADPRWRRLVPGIRAIDLQPSLGPGEVWRARLVAFRPGIPIPEHDHAGAEHTVVFQGGLDDAERHLGRGDAATMLPGEAHGQRAAAGDPCVALIISEGPPVPRSLLGRVLKTLTRS